MDDQNTPTDSYEEAVQRVESQKDLWLPETRRRQARAHEIIAEIQRLASDPTDDLPALLQQASTLPDGTAVFMSRNFVVYDADRKEIPAHQLGSIVWKDGAPSYEEFMAAEYKADPKNKRHRHTKPRKSRLAAYEPYLILKLREERIAALLRHLQLYKQEVLPYMGRRMSDLDNPPSNEEMEIIGATMNDPRLIDITRQLEAGTLFPK